MIETTMVPIMAIEPNRGQIDGVPSNPRRLDSTQFDYLVASIKENPEMLKVRELLVWEQDGAYIVIGGNMRLQAMRLLKYTECPCKIIPHGTTKDQLRSYVLKDNVTFGEWSDEDLERDWSDNDLEGWGVALRKREESKNEDADNVSCMTLKFLLSQEQFKYVKQKLNGIDKDNGIALLEVLGYGK